MHIPTRAWCSLFRVCHTERCTGCLRPYI